VSSSPPAKTPRRSKPSLGARLRRYWIPAVVLAAVVLVAGRLAVRAPVFATLTPSVSGNVKVPAAEVVAKAALDPQANVWLVDAGAVERRVESIPYVAVARLRRGIPGGATIEISERKPDACVRSDVALATIDAARRVLHSGCGEPVVYRLRSGAEFPDGSFVRDPDLARLQSDALALDARGRRLTDLGFDEFGGLEATLPSGIRVRFGDDDDLGSKERLIGPILAALDARAGRVSAIDLRAPSTPVVEHRHAVDRAAAESSTAN
jgi:cell division septal protein FtsQ